VRSKSRPSPHSIFSLKTGNDTRFKPSYTTNRMEFDPMSMTATGRSDSACVTSLPRVIIPGKSNTLSAKTQAFRDRTGTHILACHGLQEHKSSIIKIRRICIKIPPHRRGLCSGYINKPLMTQNVASSDDFKFTEVK
jgi:hypothetical protein